MSALETRAASGPVDNRPPGAAAGDNSVYDVVGIGYGPANLALAIALDEFASLDIEIARCFADAALSLLKQHGVEAMSVTALGSHGQTVRHRPNRRCRRSCTRWARECCGRSRAGRRRPRRA